MDETPQPVTLDPDLLASRHAAALDQLVEGEVRFDRHDRMLYATDASIYQVEPLGVLIPAGIEDVRRAVRYAAEHDIPMLPRGGGTSLAGQGVSRALVIDLSAHCTDLAWVKPDARRALVEPGITIDDLNERLLASGHDLFFAPDPSTARQCNIGGAIGNNAAGTRSIRYGRTAENLEAVDVILPTGEAAHLGPEPPQNDTERRLAEGVVDICLRHEALIRERFPKTLRRNAGYALDMILQDIDEARAEGADPVDRVNLAHLICGSEGTLAFITGARLILHPRPQARGLAIVGFASLDDAIDAVPACLDLGPSAVELLDDLVLSLARQNAEYRLYADLMPAPARGTLEGALYVEFFSDEGPDHVQERFGALEDAITARYPDATIATYTGAREMDQALKLRKAGEPLLHAIPGSRKPLGFVEDNAVPVERLPEFVRDFRAILDRHGTRGAFFAHASVGVLHVRPLLDPRDEKDRTAMEAIAVDVADLAKSLGGVMSGEHGDGRARGPLLERHFGPELMQAFREVKALFDPKGLLNPGNIVHPQPVPTIHESMRVRPKGHNLTYDEVDTYFDYAAEGDLAHAVELCNGSGVCRKKSGGVMCPSYMSTLDERHSTRGRGNALRLAISGQIGPEEGRPAWDDPETLETLDLCLSCKACKTECPTNVDIARYKAEYLAQTYRARGRAPLSARIIADVRRLNRLGSAFAPLSNWVANLPPTRAVSNRLLNLPRRRSLPPFARSLFTRVGPDAAGDRDAPTVLLFTDCFCAYNEPGIGEAAIGVLNAFGYRVALPDVGCCARPAISVGLLPQASRTIRRTIERLAAEIDRHAASAVLFLEPSCYSAVTDDWLALKTDAPLEQRRRLADMSFLVEDFLDARWAEHPRRPEFNPAAGRLHLHTHCHQKALAGPTSSSSLLRRVFGDQSVDVLDAGCCGMAGSFGMAAHRYDLSMKIGERSLFPSVRAAAPDDLVLATGTSCRHQVLDGTGASAIHPIEAIHRSLRG